MTLTPRASDQTELAVLRSILEGTATATGEAFFSALVDSLVAALGTMGAWVAVHDERTGALRALSMKMREHWYSGYSFPLEGTPCKVAIRERRMLHIPE